MLSFQHPLFYPDSVVAGSFVDSLIKEITTLGVLCRVSLLFYDFEGWFFVGFSHS